MCVLREVSKAVSSACGTPVSNIIFSRVVQVPIPVSDMAQIQIEIVQESMH